MMTTMKKMTMGVPTRVERYELRLSCLCCHDNFIVTIEPSTRLNRCSRTMPLQRRTMTVPSLCSAPAILRMSTNKTRRWSLSSKRSVRPSCLCLTVSSFIFIVIVCAVRMNLRTFDINGFPVIFDMPFCQVLTLSREVRVLSRRVKMLSDTATNAEPIQY